MNACSCGRTLSTSNIRLLLIVLTLSFVVDSGHLQFKYRLPESNEAERTAFANLTRTLKLFTKSQLHEDPTPWGSFNYDSSFRFADLSRSIYWNVTDAHVSNGLGNKEKYFVGVSAIKTEGQNFVVYSAGNAYEVTFEMAMSKLGATVYSFDCTVDALPEWKDYFEFYPWCIGRKTTFQDSKYAASLNLSTLIFKSLTDIRQQLNHRQVDLLKFDIEGFEWDLLEHEIVRGEEAYLPQQLLFELHTEGANPRFVPEHLLTGKRREAVAKLLLALYKRGYRLAHWEMNYGDKHCIEISMIRQTRKDWAAG